jgi:hypothetical protein
VLFWTARWTEHSRAVQLAMSQSLEAPPPPGSDEQAPATNQQNPEPLPRYLAARRALANPDPLSIFRWYTVTDFGPLYQLERADTREQTMEATEGTYAKPERTPALAAAEASKLGRAYLDWSPMPILTPDTSRAAVEQAMTDADDRPPSHGTVVTFRDPRFMGVLPWRSADSSAWLTGVVVVDEQNRVVFESMGGRPDRAQ